jgi:hypothetical protein
VDGKVVPDIYTSWISVHSERDMDIAIGIMKNFDPIDD